MTPSPFLALVLIAVVASGPARPFAQQGSGSPPKMPAQSSPGQPGARPPAASPGGYSYRPGGRRDPFVNLLERAGAPRAAAKRPAGLPGVLIDEVIVTGIIKGRAGCIATLRGPGNRSYIVRSGERLMDGSVKSVTERHVVFSQDVSDPLLPVSQREITRPVRPGGEIVQ